MMTAIAEARTQRPILVWFMAGHLANDWAPAAVWLLAPAIGLGMGLGPAEIGLLITLHSAGSALAYFPAGIVADRVHHRGNLLALTFWWVAIGYFSASFAPGFWTLALALAIAGMGDAAWHPIATGVLTSRAPGRRAGILGMHALGGTLAEVLAPLAVGFLLAVVDWRTALQVSAVPPLLLGLAFLVLRHRVPSTERHAITRGDLARMWQIWRTGSGLRLIAMIALYNMAFIAILAMSPLLMLRAHAFTPAETGIVFSVMLLAGALLQPVIGHVSDRIGRRIVFLAGNLVGAAAIVTVGTLDNTMMVIALLIVAAAALAAIRSSVLANAVDFASDREATTLGLAFALLDGVGALGGAVAGYAAGFSLAHAFYVACALSVLAVLVALTLPRSVLPDTYVPS
jgi:FSR family fosmidomycin resistance protein-like MFS transporter